MADQLLVRVDAGREVGTGHAMRCLALAQAWRDSGGAARFLMAETLPAIVERLRAEGVDVAEVAAAPGSVADAKATSALAVSLRPAWVVLDGYRFGPEFQERLKEEGCRVLAIDDYGHAGRYAADLVLNQNLSAKPGLYADRPSGTRLLLGPKYALLQRTFRERTPRVRPPAGPSRRILVTIGGVDPRNVTLSVLDALRKIKSDGLEVRIVVGSGNPNEPALDAAARSSDGSVRLERDPHDMAQLMDWADIALAAAGTTAWELAYMGVPMLLCSVAGNQRPVASALAAAGAARDLGTSNELRPETIVAEVERLLASPVDRAAMSKRAREIVDGQGVARVMTEMKAALITLRAVRDEDAHQLWEWANDKLVRSASFTTDPIPWESHVKWFAARRADPSCRFYLAQDAAGIPLGQIRFDLHEGVAEVSISLDARFRSRGYGSALILAGSRKVLVETGVARLDAYVKRENEPSVRAFLKAGYRDAGRTSVRGHEALRFVLERGTST